MLYEKIKNFFRTKNKVRAIFKDEVGKLHFVNIKYENNKFFTKKFSSDGEEYIVDQKMISYAYKDNVPCSFYNVHDPHPKSFAHERPDPKTTPDARGLNKLMEDKTVVDLFSPQGANKIDYILYITIATLFVCILIFAVQNGWIHITKQVAQNATAASGA